MKGLRRGRKSGAQSFFDKAVSSGRFTFAADAVFIYGF